MFEISRVIALTDDGSKSVSVVFSECFIVKTIYIFITYLHIYYIFTCIIRIYLYLVLHLI